MASNGARKKESRKAEGQGSTEDPAIAELSSELEQLLIERGSLDVNSLWNIYKQKYRKLPDLHDFKQFKVQKRSELIALCSTVRVENGSVQLNSGKSVKPSKKGKKVEEKFEINLVTEKESKRPNKKGANQTTPGIVYLTNQERLNQATPRVTNQERVNQTTPRVANQDTMARNYGYGPPGTGPWNMPPQYYGPPMQGFPVMSPAGAGHSRHSRRGPSVSKEELKSVLQDCIDRLSEAKEYVAVDKIEHLVKEHFKVSSKISL